MACTRYTLTNNGKVTAYFGYVKCDTNESLPQIVLNPGQSKTVWANNNSLDIPLRFANSISIQEETFELKSTTPCTGFLKIPQRTRNTLRSCNVGITTTYSGPRLAVVTNLSQLTDRCGCVTDSYGIRVTQDTINLGHFPGAFVFNIDFDKFLDNVRLIYCGAGHQGTEYFNFTVKNLIGTAIPNLSFAGTNCVSSINGNVLAAGSAVGGNIPGPSNVGYGIINVNLGGSGYNRITITGNGGFAGTGWVLCVCDNNIVVPPTTSTPTPSVTRTPNPTPTTTPTPTAKVCYDLVTFDITCNNSVIEYVDCCGECNYAGPYTIGTGYIIEGTCIEGGSVTGAHVQNVVYQIPCLCEPTPTPTCTPTKTQTCTPTNTQTSTPTTTCTPTTSSTQTCTPTNTTSPTVTPTTTSTPTNTSTPTSTVGTTPSPTPTCNSSLFGGCYQDLWITYTAQTGVIQFVACTNDGPETISWPPQDAASYPAVSVINLKGEGWCISGDTAIEVDGESITEFFYSASCCSDVTATPTPTQTATPSTTPTFPFTPTQTSSPTETPIESPCPSCTPTKSPTPTPSLTDPMTGTTSTPTPTPTPTPTTGCTVYNDLTILATNWYFSATTCCGEFYTVGGYGNPGDGFPLSDYCFRDGTVFSSGIAPLTVSGDCECLSAISIESQGLVCETFTDWTTEPVEQAKCLFELTGDAYGPRTGAVVFIDKTVPFGVSSQVYASASGKLFSSIGYDISGSYVYTTFNNGLFLANTSTTPIYIIHVNSSGVVDEFHTIESLPECDACGCCQYTPTATSIVSTPTVTPTNTSTPTATSSQTPSNSPTPTNTETQTPTPSTTTTAGVTPTNTETQTPTPTNTETPTPTSTVTPTNICLSGSAVAYNITIYSDLDSYCLGIGGSATTIYTQGGFAPDPLIYYWNAYQNECCTINAPADVIYEYSGSGFTASTLTIYTTIGDYVTCPTSTPTPTMTNTPTTTETPTNTPTQTPTATLVFYPYLITSGQTLASIDCLAVVLIQTIYASTSTWDFVTRFYTDTTLTTPFDGNNLYYTYEVSGTSTFLEIDSSGFVTNSFAC